MGGEEEQGQHPAASPGEDSRSCGIGKYICHQKGCWFCGGFFLWFFF